MPEDQKRTFEIPWATLLPVIAALAGILAQFRPLVSARPAIPGEKSIDVIAEQDADARLWQDPLVVAQKQKAELDAEIVIRGVPENRLKRHQIDALVNKVRISAAEKGSPRVLLVAVMLDSGPYIEQAESRLRARQAVLEGLNESGWVPVDSEHIGYVSVPGTPSWETLFKHAAQDSAILIPWEECKIDDRQTVCPFDTKHVYVLWLPASSFNPQPLDTFAALIRPFVEGMDNVDVKLIGPANSSGLQRMLQEPETWQPWPQLPGPLHSLTRDEVLDGVTIISPRATASDESLLGESAQKDETVERRIEVSIIPGPRGGLHFVRTVARDDLVIRALLKELKLRDIHVTPRIEKKESYAETLFTMTARPEPAADGNVVAQKEGEYGVNGDRVVILTEWDSPYGRSLATTFEKEAAPKGKYKDKDGNEVTTCISSYRYMHGIDGRLPGDSAKGDNQTQKNQPPQGPAPTEATEGLDQSDFLRRLARKLKDEDTHARRKGERGIRAIGLLGSDIYDKLMILRALRPEFRDALFFTNNFDAHFERREDWGDVRNLIVASPFCDRLPRIGPSPCDKSSEQIRSTTSTKLSPGTAPFEQHVAPFRDTNQTAMFAAALIATDRLSPSDIPRQPRVYEIGRRGAQELWQETSPTDPNSPADGNARWFWNWLRSGRVGWHLAVGAIALLLMVGWISLSVVDRRLPGGGSWHDRLGRICSSTIFWLIIGVPGVVFSVAIFSQHGTALQEPLAFFSGISLWPSEMLRLIALLLAIHFMIKASIDLRANEREIARRFHLGPRPAQRGRLRDIKLGLTRWQSEHADWLEPNANFSASEAWSAYLRRNQFWARFVRIGTLFLIYLAFSLGAFGLFPQPTIPGRGEVAFCVDFWILIPAVIGLMLLTFYVVDAIQLNSNFIRIFTGSVTKWEPDVSRRSGRIPPLEEEELSRYNTIFFVAQRTEAVAPLIWYPLIVLAVMLLARSSFFDHWTWPLSLILIFTLNATWALGSAVFLRRAAEKLRETAISNLQSLRVSSYKDPERRQMFDELISEIRGLKKGAFAPLTEQPFIRAIILPSGGLGLLAVGERLLDFF
jgi:hypothetical protein